MAKLRLIGAVGIKVRPDASGFRKDVEDQLRKLPDDAKIKIKVEANTDPAKREIDKAIKEEEKKTLQLKVGVEHDTLQAAKRQVQGLLKDLDTIKIPVKMDRPGLEKALAEIQGLQKKAQVSVNFNEDKTGYASVLAKIRQIQREKMEKSISFSTDDASLKREAAKYEKLLGALNGPDPVKTITITHRNDRNSLTTAINQIDEAMAKLKEKSVIVPSMDAEALMKERDKLTQVLARKPLVMKLTEDKKGYEKVLARIHELQAQAAEVEFKFKTDEAGLAAAAAKVQAKIAALTPTPTISFKYDYNTQSIQKALGEVNAKLADVNKIELKANLDEAGLLEAKAKLEASLANSSFQIKIDSTDLKALEAESERLSKMLNGDKNAVKIDVQNSEESLRKAKDQLDDLIKQRKAPVHAEAITWEAALQLAYTSRARVVPFYVAINQRSLAIAEGVLQSLAGINVLRESGEIFENMITKFDTFSLKAAGLSTLIGSIADSIIYMGTALFPIGEGVANLAGLLAFAPAAMASITAVILINSAAFEGFKKAIDGNAEALAKLPPEAQKTALALRGTWKQIQEPVQNSFWKGMGDAMETSFKAFIPLVAKGLEASALHVGEFGAGVFRAFEKISLAGGPLEKMLGNLTGFFDNAAGAAEPLFNAINTLGLRGSEFLPRFGQYLTDMSTRFDNWITKADEAGNITVWMEQGVQSLKDMWTLGGGVIKMFQGITMAAKDAGSGGLGDVADEFDRIGELMKAEPFQSRLSTIFDGARSGASALNVGVKQLGLTLGESSLFVANLLSQLGKLGGETLVTVSRGLANLTFQGGIMTGLQGMDSLIRQLGTGFDDLGSIIGNLSTIAGGAFTSIGPVLNNILDLINVVVGTLTNNVTALIPNLMGMVGGLISALSGPVTLIADLLNGILGFINSLPGPLAQLTIGFVGFLLLASKIGPMLATPKSGGLLEKIKYDFQQADGARDKFQVGLKGVGAGLLGAVGGPWGLAIGVLTTGLAMAGAASAESKARIDEYTSSIDANTGALNANGLASAAKNLMDEGGFWQDRTRGAKKTQESLDLLGLSFQKTAENAAKGGPAYDELMGKLDLFPGITGKGGLSMEAFADAMGISDEAASKLTKGDILHLKDRLSGVNGEAATGADNFNHLNDAMNRVPADAAAQKIADFNTAMGIYNDKTATADARTRALKAALDILNGKQPDVEEAQLKVNDAMRAAEGQLTQVGDATLLTGGAFRDAQGNLLNFNDVINATTGAISTQSTAGANLYRSLKDTTTGVLETATAMKDAKAPIGDIETYLKNARDQYIKMGTDAGLSADVVGKAYDHMIGANPKDLLTTITAQGVEDAQTRVKNYQGTLAEVNAYTAVAKIMGDDVVLGEKLANSYTKLNAFDAFIATATAKLDPTQADAVRQRIINDLINLAKTDPTVAAKLDPRILDEERVRVIARLDELARTKTTPEVKAQVEDAKAQLGIIQGLLQGIKDKNIKVKTFYSEVGKPPVHGAGQTIQNAFEADGGWWMNNVKQFANGGFHSPKVKHFANGGLENHTAQIARPSSVYRVWAEPETGGEAYIPLASSKRQRSTAILDHVASQFGYNLTPVDAFADGGVVTHDRTGGGVNVQIGSYNTNASDTPDDVARALMRRVKSAGVYTPLEGF